MGGEGGGGGDKAFKKLKFFLVSHNAFKCKSQTDYPMNLSHFPQLTAPKIWMKNIYGVIFMANSVEVRAVILFTPLFPPRKTC